MKNLKYFYILILSVFLFLFAYFIKCQLDICLIKNFPLDKFPPLSLLQDRNPYHIIYAPEANVDLFSDRYAFVAGLGKWNDLLMEKEGMVTLGSDSRGWNNSQSLLITSRSTKDWTLGHKKLIEVSPGEAYSFSSWVKISGKEDFGALSVVLYDADMQVKEWNYAMKSVTRADDWQKVEKKFIVPDGVKYIRFHLTGRGVGKAWFNEIKFKREKL